jgi:hypothetical protein
MKKLALTLLSIPILCSTLIAENLDYKCTGSGSIIKQEVFGKYNFRAWEDYDGDDVADAKITYIFDRGCYRKIRETKPPVDEMPGEAKIEDMKSYIKYLKSFE